MAAYAEYTLDGEHVVLRSTRSPSRSGAAAGWARRSRPGPSTLVRAAGRRVVPRCPLHRRLDTTATPRPRTWSTSASATSGPPGAPSSGSGTRRAGARVPAQAEPVVLGGRSRSTMLMFASSDDLEPDHLLTAAIALRRMERSRSTSRRHRTRASMVRSDRGLALRPRPPPTHALGRRGRPPRPDAAGDRGAAAAAGDLARGGEQRSREPWRRRRRRSSVLPRLEGRGRRCRSRRRRRGSARSRDTCPCGSGSETVL